jgi:hypothetical protein
MPALNAVGGDPCSLLNKTNYPTLWLDIGAEIDDKIATNGNPKKFLDSLPAILSHNILASSEINPSSPYSLIQFLSGGTIAQQTSLPYTSLGNIILQIF